MNFQKRRQQLMNMVEPNSLIIIPSASPAIRSRDIEYRYRQNSDFYYLNASVIDFTCCPFLLKNL